MERGVREWAEKEADDQADQRIAVAPQEIAEEAEEDRNEYVHHVALVGVSAEQRDDQEHRRQQLDAHDGDQRKPWNHDEVEHRRHDRADEQAHEEAPDQLRVRREQHRTRTQSLQGHRDQEDGGGRAAGNSERERGDETDGNAGIVRGFGRDDAFGRALAEALGMARGALRHAVSEEVRRGGAYSGNHSEKRAHRRALNERERIPERVPKSIPQRSFQPANLAMVPPCRIMLVSSVIANNPTITGTKLMPSSRYTKPNV